MRQVCDTISRSRGASQEFDKVHFSCFVSRRETGIPAGAFPKILRITVLLVPEPPSHGKAES